VPPAPLTLHDIVAVGEGSIDGQRLVLAMGDYMCVVDDSALSVEEAP
jgi:hypothetical protein